MVITLKSKQLEVKISEPLEGYQSSRFDWTGKVSEIFFKGVPITTNEVPNCTDPLQNGAGLYNEFSMHNALGFDDTRKSIGVIADRGASCRFRTTPM